MTLKEPKPKTIHKPIGWVIEAGKRNILYLLEQRRILHRACVKFHCWTLREKPREGVWQRLKLRVILVNENSEPIRNKLQRYIFQFSVQFEKKKTWLEMSYLRNLWEIKASFWTPHGWKQQQKFDVAIRRYFSFSRHCMKLVYVWIR